MTKVELIAAVAENAGLSKKDAEQAVNATVEAITKALAEGDKVDVKITDVDMENKKVSLSIRALLEAAPAEEEPEVEE